MKTESESSEKGVKAEQKNEELIVTSRTVEEVSPVLTSVADTLVIDASSSKETIPSKTGVFRRIKINRKSQLKTQRIEEVDQVPETPEDEIPKEFEILQSTEISKLDDIKLIEPTSLPQFKILNSKLNSILQSQADVGSAGITIMEVDSIIKELESRMILKASGLIRDSESHILEKTDQNDSSTENRINSLRYDFLKEVKDLKTVTKERHVLFVQEVKKVREDVNMQIHELRETMTKEVQHIQQGYESAHQKIDIICDAVVQCVKMFEQVNPQMISLSAKEEQHFAELVKLMKELQEISSKVSSPIISQEFLCQNFIHFEAIL
ncbi:unnamed protein product [Lactuca saligna]|uniref:Uncharacterized protein n=1 Tax=Lactuca saligna TaxID=75948 RepID=A0AA35Z0A8_LACSI|nr:unnamed protein product [Lactuca saligna]